jgi:phage/plasmid-associated DNA primase
MRPRAERIAKDSYDAPDSDIQRHYRQRVVRSRGSSVSIQDLYDDYRDWCEAEGQQPRILSVYSRGLRRLGVRKGKIARRIMYFNIELISAK